MRSRLLDLARLALVADHADAAWLPTPAVQAPCAPQLTPAQRSTHVKDAAKPLRVAELSAVSCTVSMLPRLSRLDGSVEPSKRPSLLEGEVPAPSNTLTWSKFDSVSIAENDSRTGLPAGQVSS